MSVLAVICLVSMLAVYFGGFIYFALRQPPESLTDKTDTP